MSVLESSDAAAPALGVTTPAVHELPPRLVGGLAPASIDVSVIAPLYNERGNIEGLCDEIRAALGTLKIDYEIIFVDDGSTDGSADVLARLAQADPRVVRVVQMRRNYGQTAALDAGLRVSRGRVLVPIDADLQNDPADISRLLVKIAEGADVVSGWRKDRKDPFLHRQLPSLIANTLIARCTGVPIHDFGCTLKAYRREVLRDVKLYGEMHRFVPAHAYWHGAAVTELVVNHRARRWGRSNYGIWRTLKVVLDLLTVIFLQSRYSTKPLHVFGTAGFFLFASAMVLATYVVLQKLTFPVDDARHMFVHRNPLAALAALTLVLSAGAVALGLIAELLARIYHATGAMSYAIAGYRNVPGQDSPEDGRSLPPALRALVTGPSGPGTAKS